MNSAYYLGEERDDRAIEIGLIVSYILYVLEYYVRVLANNSSNSNLQYRTNRIQFSEDLHFKTYTIN